MLRIENLDNSLFCHKIYISIYATEESQAPIANKTTKEQTRKPVVLQTGPAIKREKECMQFDMSAKAKSEGEHESKDIAVTEGNKFSVPK